MHSGNFIKASWNFSQETYENARLTLVTWWKNLVKNQGFSMAEAPFRLELPLIFQKLQSDWVLYGIYQYGV